MARPVTYQASVEEVIRHNDDVATYRLAAARPLPRLAPGQFIHLTLDAYEPGGFWPSSRVFSVANAIADRKTLRLTISRQGDYTSRILDELREGQQVWCKGPYGDFRVQPDGQAAVLIAGGTGVTPFAAFMDRALESGELPIGQVRLFYGARSEDLLIYRSLAQRCAEQFPGFHPRYFSEEPPSGDDVTQGRLDLDAIVEAAAVQGEPRYYLSGPATMIESFRTRLLEHHRVDPDRVRIDAW